MNEEKDLEIIELRGQLEDLRSRYEALELHLSRIRDQEPSEPTFASGKNIQESGYVKNLIKAACFPIAAGLIRLVYKFISRLKK